MKRLPAMAWKEWHEVRTFLWIAFGVFIGLPSVAGVEVAYQYAHGFQFVASPWIGIFGGVLAVFVAVGITCRDLNGRLEDFWRSRPVGAAEWMLVKFVAGLATVLVACILPLAIEFVLAVHKDDVEALLWFPFLWNALYGLGFLSGCLVRRPSHAAMLGLVAMLLVYLLPFVLPPLEWLNIKSVMDEPTRFLRERAEFAAGMLGIAAAALVFSLVAVTNSWQIASGRKFMYGSVSAVLVILFASASYQLGTNMPILQQVAIRPDETVTEIQMSGDRGYILTSWGNTSEFEGKVSIRPVIVRQDEIEVGEAIETDVLSSKNEYSKYYQWLSDWSASPEGHPEIRYFMESSGEGANSQLGFHLARIDQGSERLVRSWKSTDWAFVFVRKNRLYLVGEDVMTWDISQPLEPELISVLPAYYQRRFPDFWLYGDDVGVMPLPLVPGLSARQRLEVILARGWGRRLLEGDVYCNTLSYGEGLCAYSLVKLTDIEARFKKIGEYKQTLLDKAFGEKNSPWGIAIENGLVYVTQGGRYAATNPHITVFNTGGPHPLREVGHFAAPGLRVIYPLADGRTIVGGTGKLWLIGPPPNRE